MNSAHETHETEHDFVLVLDNVTDLSTALEDALFEAGCDDATISLRFGRVYLTFSRVAPTLKDAILSAIRDVRKSGVGTVLRIDDCNLVTQADIARKLKRSRQCVHQYVTGERGPGKFPSPVCGITDEQPLWRWCEVSYWLMQANLIKEDVYREARDIATINSVLEYVQQQKLDASLIDEVYEAVAPYA